MSQNRDSQQRDLSPWFLALTLRFSRESEALASLIALDKYRSAAGGYSRSLQSGAAV